MNVVDSSAWLEYFAGAPGADFFTPPIQNLRMLLVPSICLAEVFRWVLREQGEAQALTASAAMKKGFLVDLDATIAVAAAKIGYELKLPLADSIILATARSFDATLWTQDAHFQNIANVRFLPKQ